MKTYKDFEELFRTEFSAVPEPAPDNWNKIQKKMKKRDLWHSPKMIWSSCILVGIALLTTILILQKTNDTKNTAENIVAQIQTGKPGSTIVNPDPTEPKVLENKSYIKSEKPEEEFAAKTGGKSENIQKPAETEPKKNNVSESDRTYETGNISIAEKDNKSNRVSITGIVSESSNISETGMVSKSNRITELNTIPEKSKMPEKNIVSETDKISDTKSSSSHTVEDVISNDSLNIVFPSAFTPNGDGLNDYYRASISGKTSQFLLRIYNTSQQLLFQTTKQEEAWDGTYKGTDQPHGLYIYTCSCTDEFGRKYILKGEFLLLKK